MTIFTSNVFSPHRRRDCPLLLALVLGLSNAGFGQDQAAASRFDWTTAKPQTAGLSEDRLEAMRRALEAQATKALLIIRDDQIVLEWYAPDFSPTRTHYIASMAKAVAAGLAAAVAI